ncbi:MAG: hypothetical protein DMD33_19380 [Gemmatimonadetes bacterium]|nr:MAG: hypothetical protein DMD33_19380 [Gemmatimonadota bacterium]
MRASRLLAVETLTDFAFTFRPSLKREQLESLRNLGFIDRRENVALLGPALQDVLAALSRSVLRKDAVATSAHRKRSGGRQQSRGSSDEGHARQWAQLGKLLM